jgi:hypothetical protein
MNARHLKAKSGRWLEARAGDDAGFAKPITESDRPTAHPVRLGVRFSNYRET